MKRRMYLTGMIVVCSMLLAVPPNVTAAEGAGADGDAQVMTHGQLAQLLVRKLGLHDSMAPNPSDLECMMELAAAGIFPSPTLTPTETDPTPGWSLDPGAPVTLAELAVILVRALRLEDAVEGDKTDPQNWLNVLQSVNIPTDTVVGGVGAVRPLAQILLEISVAGTSGDLLRRTYIPDSRGSLILDTLHFPDREHFEAEPVDDVRPRPRKKLKDEGIPTPITPVLPV